MDTHKTITGVIVSALVVVAGCAARHSPPGPEPTGVARTAPPAGFAAAVNEPWTPPPTDVPAERHETLAERALLRAFDGAPPVIPHEIMQMSSADCLDCHGWSPEADARGAPKVPHTILANCTQCHVEEVSEYFVETEWATNSFEGRPAPPGGHRAFDGAPPVVPHTTHMRSACLSCHGPFGPAALHNDHPQRQSCLQCHAISARLDHGPTTPAP